MKITKTMKFSLNKHFGFKCRSCNKLRSKIKEKEVIFYCSGNVDDFPRSKDCKQWKAEWDEGIQNVTLGDAIAKKLGVSVVEKR